MSGKTGPGYAGTSCAVIIPAKRPATRGRLDTPQSAGRSVFRLGSRETRMNGQKDWAALLGRILLAA
ncbi:MAG TPA: hypothetical protein VF014_00880, partial [Casimicrobiaceae bacterium]|nr:hypothetical protein [Casimicrobiaceae bacterium]